MKIKHIEIYDSESVECLVHYDGAIHDQTLCGLEQDGDEDIGLHPGKETNKRVTCDFCLCIIEHCKKILKQDGRRIQKEQP